MDRSGCTCIGVVGTAKNTGKTTTLSFLLVQATRRNIAVGVTSIGYDGEDIDTVTSLPKPRMSLEPGVLVTTAERCLPLATAGYEILSRTGVQTALGEILLLRVIREGLVVTAGPHKRSLIEPMCELLGRHGASLIFIDGALNRIAPMSAAEKIIFTTGAARNTDPSVLAEEMRAIEHILSIPLAEGMHAQVIRPSLFDAEDVADTVKLLSSSNRFLEMTQMISLAALSALAAHTSTVLPAMLILPDPMVLLLAGDPVQTTKMLGRLAARGCQIRYRRSPALGAITVNPFYPKLELFTYTSAFVDKIELLSAMRQAVSVPVYDVKEGGAEELFDRLV
ncbi:MAG: hypothetical protein NTV54_11550 [Ignavibacteriales bacterium]|nr:hypothetical protein [Ignavibacteriales bacterium]